MLPCATIFPKMICPRKRLIIADRNIDGQVDMEELSVKSRSGERDDINTTKI